MYKVFINNKPIFFIENDEVISKLDSPFLFQCDNQNDKELILEQHKNTQEPVYVQGADFDKIWGIFFDDYKVVEAAGGLVINDKEEILFIFRNGFWDLPKGKIEKGEEIEYSAVREVEEECGIIAPVLEKKLLITYHTYVMDGVNCIKPTHWFLMRYNGSEKLIPQEEEGITKVEWVKQEAVSSKLENTFGSIIDVVEYFKKEFT